MWWKRVLVVLLGIIFISPLAANSPFTLPVSMVVLDAGHGGHDPGAVTQRDGSPLVEKDIVLDLTLRIAEYLRNQESHLEVILTREDDRYVTLEDRADRAAQQDPGIGKSLVFVSIHVNSSNSNNASGFEILRKKTNQWVRFLDAQSPDWEMLRYANFTAGELNRSLNRENLLLASTMREELTKALPEMRNRGIKEQDVWVLHATQVPAVLVEVGFLSSDKDAACMTQESWLTTMSEAIGNGILRYINGD